MDESQLATIRKSDSDRDVAYIQAGVISAEEVRGRLASDTDSGYNGIDVDDVPMQDDFGGLGMSDETEQRSDTVPDNAESRGGGGVQEEPEETAGGNAQGRAKPD